MALFPRKRNEPLLTEKLIFFNTGVLNFLKITPFNVRFRSLRLQEVVGGLRTVETTMKAAKTDAKGQPIDVIPTGCYDSGDGFYDPASSNVYNYLPVKDVGEDPYTEEECE